MRIRNLQKKKIYSSIESIGIWVFTLTLLVFPLGYHAYLPVLALWLTLCLISINPNTKELLKNHNIILALPLLFFIIQFIGLRSQNNLPGIQSQFETKASFLLVPLFYPWLNKKYSDRVKILIIAISIGTFAISIFCLVKVLLHSSSFENWIFKIDFIDYKNNFGRHHRTEFSHFMHPSYFALMTTFALAGLWYIRNQILSKSIWLNMILISMAGIFMLDLILLQSRAGFLAFSALVVISIFYWILTKKKYFIGIIFLVLFFLGFGFLIQEGLRFKEITQTVKNMHKTGRLLNNNKNETEIRLWIWDSVIDIIKEHPIAGVGIAGTQEALQAEYLKRDMKKAYEKQYNAHNQYLQTWLEAGLPGLLVLLAMLGIPFAIAIRQRNFLLFSFIFLISFHLMFESMFNRVDGIVFFILFYCILSSRYSSYSIKKLLTSRISNSKSVK